VLKILEEFLTCRKLFSYFLQKCNQYAEEIHPSWLRWGCFKITGQ